MLEECVCQPVVQLAGICKLRCCRKVVMFIREVDSAILKHRNFFFVKIYLPISGLAPKPSLSDKANTVPSGSRIFWST